MRKITSKAEEKKKKRRNQLLVGGILILVMILSVLGYSAGRDEGDENEKIIYNNFKFVKQNEFWSLNIENLQFLFKYNPNEVESIDTVLNPLDNYLDKPLYIYSEDSGAEAEIYKNLIYYNPITERMQKACLAGEKCEEDLPVKTCKDNFIIIKKSENTMIKQEDNCVFIDGKEEDLVKLSDGFLFKIIGIQ